MLVLGGSGLVGSSLLARWVDPAGEINVIAPSHAELDVLDQPALERFVRDACAKVIINLVAWADVDGAEAQQGDTSGRVYALNVDLPRHLARLGTHLVHISTDYVFDGKRAQRPYLEDDAANPVCWYAETKWQGEQAIRESGSSACIARIEMPFTSRAHYKRDLARTIAQRLHDRQSVQGVSDQRITPVLLDDAAAAVKQLIQQRYVGTIHVAASDWTTPFDFARGIAQRLNLSKELIQPAYFDDFSKTRPARRPQHSWLDIARFTREFGTGILRPVEAELDTWAAQLA